MTYILLITISLLHTHTHTYKSWGMSHREGESIQLLELICGSVSEGDNKHF